MDDEVGDSDMCVERKVFAGSKPSPELDAMKDEIFGDAKPDPGAKQAWKKELGDVSGPKKKLKAMKITELQGPDGKIKEYIKDPKSLLADLDGRSLE